MARQLYETENDKARERGIANVVEKRWGLELKKLPISQRLDYACLRRGVVVGLIEIKYRKFTWGDYPDVMLSASKIKFASEMFNAFGIRSSFVVCDQTHVVKQTPIVESNCSFKLAFGGRTLDARDDQDSELIVNIPNGYFKTIGYLTTEDWS